MKTNEETLSVVMNRLGEKGYKEQFKLTKEGLKVISSGKTLSPKEVKILHRYRFDGMTNPDDESMLYALETQNGLKGTLVVSGNVHSEQNQSILNRIPSEI